MAKRCYIMYLTLVAVRNTYKLIIKLNSTMHNHDVHKLTTNENPFVVMKT